MKKELNSSALSEDKRVSVIFETDDKQALKDAIEAAGGTVTIEYKTVDMLAADIPLKTLSDILSNPHVLHVHKDRLQWPTRRKESGSDR